MREPPDEFVLALEHLALRVNLFPVAFVIGTHQVRRQSLITPLQMIH